MSRTTATHRRLGRALFRLVRDRELGDPRELLALEWQMSDAGERVVEAMRHAAAEAGVLTRLPNARELVLVRGRGAAAGSWLEARVVSARGRRVTLSLGLVLDGPETTRPLRELRRRPAWWRG